VSHRPPTALGPLQVPSKVRFWASQAASGSAAGAAGADRGELTNSRANRAITAPCTRQNSPRGARNERTLRSSRSADSNTTVARPTTTQRPGPTGSTRATNQLPAKTGPPTGTRDQAIKDRPDPSGHSPAPRPGSSQESSRQARNSARSSSAARRATDQLPPCSRPTGAASSLASRSNEALCPIDTAAQGKDHLGRPQTAAEKRSRPVSRLRPARPYRPADHVRVAPRR
jgi:hypothetical protein